MDTTTRLHRRRREARPVRGVAPLVSVDAAARTDRTDADLATPLTVRPQGVMVKPP